jgi:hypothetical protein
MKDSFVAPVAGLPAPFDVQQASLRTFHYFDHFISLNIYRLPRAVHPSEVLPLTHTLNFTFLIKSTLPSHKKCYGWAKVLILARFASQGEIYCTPTTISRAEASDSTGMQYMTRRGLATAQACNI